MSFNHIFLRLMTTALSCIFLLSLIGCAKTPSKTTVVEKSALVEQQVAVEKQPSEASQSGPEEKTILQPLPEKKTPLTETSVDTSQTASSASQTVKKEPTSLSEEHIVKKGESLWWIAKYKNHYNDPYIWQIIYKANKTIIKNPNRIYPGQRLLIPRKGYTMKQIQEARRQAGAQRPYTPPARAVLPLD